VSRKNNS